MSEVRKTEQTLAQNADFVYFMRNLCQPESSAAQRFPGLSPIADLNGHRVLAKKEADRSRFKLVASTAKTIVATSKPLLTAFTAAIMEALPWQ
jgi:hypothetical protein